VPVYVDGHSLRGMTKSQKAAVGVSLLRGVFGRRFTTKIAAVAVGVSAAYVARALALSPDDLQAVKLGQKTLQDIRQGNKRSTSGMSTYTTVDLCIERLCRSKGMSRESAEQCLLSLFISVFSTLPSEEDVEAFVRRMDAGH
jgi:hypothetical protein